MKYKQVLVCALIFLLPTQLGKHFFFPFSFINGVRIDYLAPTLYITDIFIILLSLFYIKDMSYALSFRTKRSGAEKSLSSFFVLLLVALNIIFALSPWIALYKGFKYVEIIVLFFIIAKSKFSSRYLLITLAASTLVQLWIAGSQVITGKSIQGFMYFLGERYFTISTPGIAKVVLQGKEILRGYGTFSHPNSLAGFYLLVYTYILFEKRFKSLLLLKYVVLGTSALLIFLSFSKIAIVIFFLINAYYIVRNVPCKLCSVGRILGLIILSAIFLSAQGDSESLAKRIQLISNSITIIINHPLLGVGFGNYLIAQSAFPITYSYYFLQPVHNIFLLFLAEVGIPLTLLVFYFAYRFLKVFTQKQGHMVIPLLAIIFITGFFDHYWLTLQQNMLVIPVVFGLLKNTHRE